MRLYGNLINRMLETSTSRYEKPGRKAPEGLGDLR